MPVSTILIADDEASIRSIVREILEYEHYMVEEAEDGEDTLAKIRRQHYDLVLLDIKMPKLDGMELLKIVALEMPKLVVVMISGHGMAATAIEATRHGAFDFIEKPPDLNHLLCTVRKALAHSPSRATAPQRTPALPPA